MLPRTCSPLLVEVDALDFDEPVSHHNRTNNGGLATSRYKKTRHPPYVKWERDLGQVPKIGAYDGLKSKPKTNEAIYVITMKHLYPC